MTYVLMIIIVILLIALIIMQFKNKNELDIDKLSNNIKSDTNESIKSMHSIINENQKLVNSLIGEKITILDKNLNLQQKEIKDTMLNFINQQENRFNTFSVENIQNLENIRKTLEDRLTHLQKDNNNKLDEMRKIVDEKLQKTLEDKMNKSFSLVSDRLEQVYKGLGEMQSLASGVGDLKKVLTNVKTRGIVGEIQLGAILEEILTKEQYDINVEVIPNSKNVVEFAIKLPGKEDKVYLPIDSKFPGDTYTRLLEAYEDGDKSLIENARKALISTIQKEAKDISTKYIQAPFTTEFAIMFLPFEGLYAEVINLGLVEKLQHEYKINIAGPSTMAAMLNSLQMGFKTLAIQKRSSEVWNVLAAVKTEFDKFEMLILDTRKRLEMADKDLEKLVGVRTRAINRKLRDVSTIAPEEALEVLNNDLNSNME